MYTNLLEEKVSSLTDAYLEGLGKSTDSKLKVDIVIYTLNRIPPQYVMSGRGILHTLLENEKSQTTADILRVISEAYNIITTRREFDLPEEQYPVVPVDGYYFVFPEIVGTVFNGETFTRLNYETVGAYQDGELIPSFGSSFPNPIHGAKESVGQYIFRFNPRKAEKDGVIETATVKLVIKAESFGEQFRYLKLAVKSEYLEKGSMPSFDVHTVENIYMTKGE